MEDFIVEVASEKHIPYIPEILKTIEDATKVRGTGIAKRKPEYIEQKMREGKAIIAMKGDIFAGFCYIESWDHEKFVANSGLIVKPEFRGKGLAKAIKKKAFELSRSRFPNAKIFGLTTGAAVMKINTELGYVPVTFEDLTTDPTFWKGCESCINYDVLTRNNFTRCLCTGMLYRPAPKKVVVAFSGGLDTSFTVSYLANEKGYEVYAACANTGGFSAEQLKQNEENAYKLGAKKYVTLDVTKEYYEKTIKYMVYGNVLRNGTYPISVSSERIFQAMAIARYAKEIGADAIAHGSTGAGNDQVRFDLTFQILAPEIKIIAPTRDMTLTRDYEINYLKEHGYVADFKKMEYSINKGLWGTSIGGKETLRSNETLPEEAYPTQMTATSDSRLAIDFEKGEIAAVNGEKFTNKVAAIQRIEELVNPYAIGRDMHIGDTIIGIKGRVGFEAGAPLLIIAAHKMLEKHTLTKWQQYWKEQLGNWYGMFLHEAQYLEPVMRDIEAYLTSSQENVTGRVLIDLKPYHYVLVGVESDFDLMKTDFGEYGEINKAWTADDIKGFTKILGNQMKIFHNNQVKNNKA